MNNFKLLLFGVLTIFIFAFDACKHEVPMEDKVIAIHDEVMVRMGEIDKAKKDLRSLLASTPEEEKKSIIIEGIDALQKAHDGMFEWMDAWKVPEDAQEKKRYLDNEMIRINKVKTDILTSIEKANKILTESKK